MDLDSASDPLLEVPPPDMEVAKMDVEKVVEHVTELSRASQVEENKMKKSRMEKLLDTVSDRLPRIVLGSVERSRMDASEAAVWLVVMLTDILWYAGV
jgi:hypothetical protein